MVVRWEYNMMLMDNLGLYPDKMDKDESDSDTDDDLYKETAQTAGYASDPSNVTPNFRVNNEEQIDIDHGHEYHYEEYIQHGADRGEDPHQLEENQGDDELCEEMITIM